MELWQPGASPDTLRARAEMLANVRSFFTERAVLEVETPSISRCPTMDQHLDSLSLESDSQRFYLITSPEYHMKRLIAAGMGSVYQICKSFRADEAGASHNPEFTMIEWYKIGWDHYQLMDEVEALLDRLLQCGKAERVSYREVFEQHLAINPFEVTHQHFLQICENYQVTPPDFLVDPQSDREDWLDFLMGVIVEPKLGEKQPIFIDQFPATQSSLAKLHPENREVTLRFEVYYKGRELGNGYSELTDAKQQKSRMLQENENRKKSGKPTLPFDERLQAAMEHGLPECAGIAIGFDRLVMLALEKDSIDQVQSFSWRRC